MSSNVEANRTHDAGSSGFHITVRHVQIFLVIVGLLITGYMSYNKLAEIPLQCSETGIVNCSVVENSAWARIFGIPTALYGFTAHLMLGAVLVLEKRTRFFGEYAPILMFGIALFSIMYHSYLTFVSITILKAICPYCLAAATTMLFQLIASSVRFKRYLSAP